MLVGREARLAPALPGWPGLFRVAGDVASGRRQAETAIERGVPDEIDEDSGAGGASFCEIGHISIGAFRCNEASGWPMLENSSAL
jgi:hypothetical protein